MKAETYYPINSEVVENIITRVMRIGVDSTVQVRISNTGTKSTKQRSLDWMWNEDIAKAGIGGKYSDTDKGVHRVSKYHFAIPIYIRDFKYFPDLYSMWRNKYEFADDKVERMMYFVDEYVSTEKFSVSQMAEYLTAKQMFYLSKGVNLTDPKFRGLLD